ncbi:Protein FAM65A isoform X2 [Oopsacas minuta]|uniref:Protein FAM65A isoform X2 n=1 Tax=Oopsacas minuta TaxID=111878 RepID=A0AAV7JEY9_9METZ|nr:Protein FAM65A isoform X2 [Oopsacas minuta]
MKQRFAYTKFIQGLFPTIANQITTTTFDDGEQPDVQNLTIFQFYNHFKTKIISGLEEYVSEVAEDLSLYEGLASEERYIVNVTLKRMAGMGYNTGILRAIPHMLLKPNESCQIADNYLKNITRDTRILEEVGTYFISILEHSDQTIRQGACRALGRIKYAPSIAQLKYIQVIDASAVRQEAKQALNRICP